MLLIGCKQEQPVAAQLDRLKTPQTQTASNNDDTKYDSSQNTDSAAQAMDTMASDLQIALTSDGGLSANDAAAIMDAVKASSKSAGLRLDSGTAASVGLGDLAINFFAAVEKVLHSDKVKIADMDKVLKATGSFVVSSIKKAYIAESSAAKDPDLTDPALIKMLADVLGNTVAKQSAAIRLSDAAALLQGVAKGVSAEGLSTAQIAAILANVSASVSGLSAKDMAAADVQKLAGEAVRGLMSSVSAINAITPADLATHVQGIVQETIKGIGNASNFDKNTMPDLVHVIASNAMAGSGAAAKIDSAGAVVIAKAIVQGIVEAIKALNPINYVSLADKITSEGIAGVKEGVVKIPGLDEKALDGLHIDPNDILAQLSGAASAK